jgi:beta-lactamase regulating signal transducer with metallopeptidase domain
MSGLPHLDGFVDWLATFALHSSCALGAALLVGLVLGDRALAWQERLLRFALWAGLVSSGVQWFVLGGPLAGGWWQTQGIAAAVASFPPPAGRFEVFHPAVAVLPASASWSAWLGVSAIASAVAGLAWLWWSRRRLAQLLARRRPEADQRVLAISATLARELGLRRAPRVSRCADLATPIAFGCLRPEIGLPERVDQLDDGSLRAMLAHELAHLRRRDPAAMCVVTVLQALFPWQLLLPLVRRRWLRLVELRCDAVAAAATSPTAVARCLLEIAAWLRMPAAAPGAALAMAARPSTLRRRVEAALRGDRAAPPRRLWSAAFGGVSLSALTILGPGVAARPASPAVAAASPPPAASPWPSALAERAALVAEALQLQAEVGAGPVAPDLEPLLQLLQRRLDRLDRLAARIEQRLASGAHANR